MAVKHTITAKDWANGQTVEDERPIEKTSGAVEMAEPQKRLTVAMPASLHTKLKIYGVQHQITLNDILLNAIKEYMEKRDN